MTIQSKDIAQYTFFCHSVYSAVNFGVAVRAIGEIRECTRITPRESRGGDSHERSHFARSTIPEEKWETTRSLKMHWPK